VTKLYNLTSKKRGGDEVIPLEFNLLEHLLKESRTWAPILHIYGKEKMPTIPK
jgi:hypothetical protein